MTKMDSYTFNLTILCLHVILHLLKTQFTLHVEYVQKIVQYLN